MHEKHAWQVLLTMGVLQL